MLFPIATCDQDNTPLYPRFDQNSCIRSFDYGNRSSHNLNYENQAEKFSSRAQPKGTTIILNF